MCSRSVNPPSLLLHDIAVISDATINQSNDRILMSTFRWNQCSRSSRAPYWRRCYEHAVLPILHADATAALVVYVPPPVLLPVDEVAFALRSNRASRRHA